MSDNESNYTYSDQDEEGSFQYSDDQEEANDGEVQLGKSKTIGSLLYNDIVMLH
jgi:hypothetical protein